MSALTGRMTRMPLPVSSSACPGHQRPLAEVVKRNDAKLTAEELLGYYDRRIAQSKVTHGLICGDASPSTATGKTQTLKLREQFTIHTFSTPLKGTS